MSTPHDRKAHGRDRLWHLPTPAHRLLLMAPPLAFAGFTILHPQPDETTRSLLDASTWFMAYHMIQLPLIGLVAISIFLLADAFGRASAWPMRRSPCRWRSRTVSTTVEVSTTGGDGHER